MNCCNVPVTDRCQGNETEIEKLRLKGLSAVCGDGSLNTEGPRYPERDQVVGHGPHHSNKQVGGNRSHDSMGSRRPFAKSLMQNKKSEEHQEEKSKRVNNEAEGLVRKQMLYPRQD